MHPRIVQLMREARAIATLTLGVDDGTTRDDATRVMIRLLEQAMHAIDAPERSMWGEATRRVRKRGRDDA